ncbi:hypothetical protein XF24_00743 [candidate division SR1 bacterium Aalborg_AAW-1]|nr:hypothetical protein XF24_00743 [candidate division SR1 bacterium Aalborg_AAW-1]
MSPSKLISIYFRVIGGCLSILIIYINKVKFFGLGILFAFPPQLPYTHFTLIANF